MIDLHNHILPGLDDGPRSIEESIAMAKAAVADGIRAIVCTPHWVRGTHPNTRAVIIRKTRELNYELKRQNIPLAVRPGAELRLDLSLIDGVSSGKLMTLNDTGHYVLIELPDVFPAERLEGFLWELINRNITPILAHPERNATVQRDPSRVHQWVQMGALTQITAASVLGVLGSKTQKLCFTLLEHELVHVVATDAHGAQPPREPALSRACKLVGRISGEDAARRLMTIAPWAILQGKGFTFPAPIPFSATKRKGLLRKALSSLFFKA